jgi:hypothetical protein
MTRTRRISLETPTSTSSSGSSPHGEDLPTAVIHKEEDVSEQGDQHEDRDQEQQQGASSSGTGSEQQGGLSNPGGTSVNQSEGDDRENRGDSSSGETPPTRGELPSEEDRKEGTQRGNRESGTDDSGSQQGDVAHEGDLPTEGVPDAD